MERNLGKVAAGMALGMAGVPWLPARPCGLHLLARDKTFSATDCVCHEGSCSPTFEGQYSRACISVVLSGAFHARSSQGEVLLGPGTLLLGNASSAYEYRHVDDGGDRSLVFDYEEALLEEVGRSLGVRYRGAQAFGRVCIPASPASAEAVVLAHEALLRSEAEALREAALAVAAVALEGGSGGTSARVEPSATQVRRVAQTVRYVEAHSTEDCSLDRLADHAGLSSFHFLRIFRELTGQTPRQFVIATRLRSAATALRATRERIIDVALEAGFGDLSHFTTSFTRAFGVSPRAYRKQRGLARL